MQKIMVEFIQTSKTPSNKRVLVDVEQILMLREVSPTKTIVTLFGGDYLTIDMSYDDTKQHIENMVNRVLDASFGGPRATVQSNRASRRQRRHSQDTDMSEQGQGPSQE